MKFRSIETTLNLLKIINFKVIDDIYNWMALSYILHKMENKELHLKGKSWENMCKQGAPNFMVLSVTPS